MTRFILFFFLILASPLAAQDRDGVFSFGGDRFQAGRSISPGPVEGDLFAAGNRVSVQGDVGGSAHVAGRKVTIDGEIGGNLYAAGMDVDLDGEVLGNASLAGNGVRVGDPVAGNLRAMGSDVVVTAPVAGSAILGGETVSLDAAIAGDLAIGAEEMDWGAGALVLGQVHVYVKDGDTLEVPDRVASADRVTVHPMSEWDENMPEGMEEDRPRGFWARLGGLFGSVLITGLFATALAIFAPGFMAGIRERVIETPGRSLWMGALALSAVAGSTVVLAMTGIGIFIAPLSIFAALLLGCLGYVIGAYIIGVWALTLTGQSAPDSHADRAIAAFVGAGLLTIAALVPFIGWLAVVAVLLVGIGGLAVRVVQPGFFTEA
ncbi:MAG TPA: hypothetical protein DEO85_12945 [Maritimibacter sp.]|nr:hypothetical protein [Maritimibacter sp.]